MLTQYSKIKTTKSMLNRITLVAAFTWLLVYAEGQENSKTRRTDGTVRRVQAPETSVVEINKEVSSNVSKNTQLTVCE
jgi:hypothetical protein